MFYLMSYLGFLARDTLFSLLVRLHYTDLITLVKAKPYLSKITGTKYFEEQWKNYNIRLIKIEYVEYGPWSTHEVDRQGLKHGLTTSYDYNNRKTATQEYINDQKHGLYTHFYQTGLQANRETNAIMFQIMYQHDLKNGSHRLWSLDGEIEVTTTYKDGFSEGLEIYHSVDQKSWIEYRKGKKMV